MQQKRPLMQEEIHESEDTNAELTDENNCDSTLRRRKGKIISCAKETIENGEINNMYFYFIAPYTVKIFIQMSFIKIMTSKLCAQNFLIKRKKLRFFQIIK